MSARSNSLAWALRRRVSSAATSPSSALPPKFPVPLPRDDIPHPSSLFDHSKPTPAYSRMREHYYRTLATDLLYLTYNHNNPFVPQRLPNTKYIPGLNRHNANFKKHEIPKYYDTNMRKPLPPRTPRNLPQLHSIIVTSFLKEAIDNKFVLLNALTQIEAITGKHPDIIRAKSNVALWKLREGMPVGCQVVLTDDDMFQFIDKFVELVLPRLKNWYGIDAQCGDGTGNIKLGFESKVMSYFPEIEQTFDRYPFMCAFDLTFRTSAYTDWEARLLLSGFQIPIENAVSKAKREKYLQVDVPVDPDEPEWMKHKRAREATEAKNKK